MTRSKLSRKQPPVITFLIAFTLTLFLFAPPGYAQIRSDDGFADLVEDLIPAVVNISTSNSTIRPTPRPGGSREGISLGSGFVIDQAGIVVTNNHVIDGAGHILVTLHDGREFDAVVRGRDPETDIAVLELKGASGPLPRVRIGDSDKARVGSWVIAIGNPFGLGGSVSLGIISARNRDIEAGVYDDFIQTDAAINRGNSGGPLFNTQGEVIGVNTAIFSQSGGSVGVGFSVPSNLASSVIEQLLTYGETQRGWLGVNLEEVTNTRVKELGLRSRRGALVSNVVDNSPAQFAGIEENDVIVKFNNIQIVSVRELSFIVAETQIGVRVPVQVRRGRRLFTLNVILARRETSQQLSSGEVLSDPTTADWIPTKSGAELSHPTQEIIEDFGLSSDVTGAVVTNVTSESVAAGVLQPGDVIVRFAGEDVADSATLAEKLDHLYDAQIGPIEILYLRGDELVQTWLDLGPR